MNDSEKKDFQDTCTKLCNEVMRPLVMQKEFVYIDADLLFDFRLGALISLIRHGAEDYKYILEHLNEYLEAPTLECAKFFPKLGLTEKDLDDQWKKPDIANALAAISPPTKFMQELGDIIRVINTINRQKESIRPVRLTINQRQVILHDHIKHAIESTVHAVDADVIINFTHYPTWEDVPKELISKQDVICLYDIKDFLKQGSSSQKVLSDTNDLATCDIMAVEQSELSPEETQTGLANLVNVMQLMCEKFTFIKKTILTNKDYGHG